MGGNYPFHSPHRSRVGVKFSASVKLREQVNSGFRQCQSRSHVDETDG